jgi:hypothetical protein
LPLAIPAKSAKSFKVTISRPRLIRQQDSTDGFMTNSAVVIRVVVIPDCDVRPRTTTVRKPAHRKPPARRQFGVGQLSLVEHSLCPLDARVSLRPGFHHESSFQYSDAQRRRKTARVEVSCPHGLSAHDEFYLWGLLALTLSQPNPEPEFHATPHYCLRALGLVDANSRRGGRQYEQFAAAIERLSWVKYGSDAFYDPIRAEHCQVRFGFFSYRLPFDPTSSRAWRFHWDGQFFEFVKSVGGSLRFDLELYRKLSPAGRRLFLFVSKVFARAAQTPRMDVRHLAVDVLGLSANLPVKHLLAKSRRICAELAAEGILMELRPDTIQKRETGRYEVVLHRGDGFLRRQHAATNVSDSPLAEPLRSIGLDEAGVARVLKQFPASKVREWADITLAAQERFGASFFKRSPAAYFLDNLKKSVADGRTPPDWWHDVRKAEEREQARRDRSRPGQSSAAHTVNTSSRQAFEQVRRDLFQQLQSAGLDERTAFREATRQAQQSGEPKSVRRKDDLAPAKNILATLPIKLA